jgi:hypothetical protein
VGDENTLPIIEELDTWKEGDEVELEGRMWKILDCGHEIHK